MSSIDAATVGPALPGCHRLNMAPLLLQAFLIAEVLSSVLPATECPFGYYKDDQSLQCAECQPCPIRAFDDSGEVSRIHKCIADFICPYWCADSSTDNTTAICKKYYRGALQVSINANATYDPLTRKYNLTCNFTSIGNGIPEISVYNSTQLLSSLSYKSRSGYRSVLIPVLKPSDEGLYKCKVSGVYTNAQDTILLQYIEPTTVTPTTKEQTTEGGKKITSDGGNTGKSIQPSGTDFIVIMSTLLGGIVIVSLCAFLAICWICWIRKNKHRSSSGRERVPLISSAVQLITSNFRNYSLQGLETIWTQGNYSCLEIKKKKKMIKTVDRNGDGPRSVSIEGITWRDAMSLYVRANNSRESAWVADVKVNCLVIPETEIDLTSAVILCPPDNGIFVFKLSSSDSDTSVQPVRDITGGREEIRDLRPGLNYRVELATKDQHGMFSWTWSESFTTKCPTVAATSSSDGRTATLSLTPSVQRELHVSLRVNEQCPKEVSSQSYTFQELVPGCKQVAELEINEDGQVRTLQKIVFNTSGSPQLLGDYHGDVTSTDNNSEAPNPPSVSRRHMAPSDRRRTRDACNTGFQEAIDKLRGERTYGTHFCQTDSLAMKLIMQCLQEMFAQKTGQTPLPIIDPENRCLPDVLDMLKELNLEDMCGIFPILKKFVDEGGYKSEGCMEFARALYETHFDRCEMCAHMVFLLKWLRNNPGHRSR